MLSAKFSLREEGFMTIQTTVSKARASFARLLDDITANNEIAIVTRRGAKAVAILPIDELSALLETLHLMESPKNAERLLVALRRAKSTKLGQRKQRRLARECAKLDPLEEQELAEGRGSY
jgi:antitoxin YefM